MAPRAETYDLIAADLAQWLEQMSNALAVALSPQGVAPFAAPISEATETRVLLVEIIHARRHTQRAGPR